MGLLPVNDIKAIAKNAIDWGLANSRDVLFVDFDQGTRANIMVVPNQNETPASLLRRDLDKLNSLTDHTAEGVIVLAVWLDACALAVALQYTRAAFFAEWAAKVRALPTSVPANSAEAAATIAGALDKPGPAAAPVTQLADDLDGYIDKLAIHAEVLVRAKRLHDNLHILQTLPYPMLRQAAAMGPALANFAQLAVSPLTMIANATPALAAEVDAFGPADPLRVLVEKLAVALKDTADGASNAVVQMRAAASADPPDAAAVAARLAEIRAAVGQIGDLIKEDMSNLESEIHQRIGQMQPGQALPLDQLVAALNRLAEASQVAELKDAASRAVQSLTVIWIDLSTIDDRHHDWQQVDAQLWLLEMLFDRLGQGFDDGLIFASVWPGVVKQIEKFSSAPKPEWASRIDSLVEKFLKACPQPPKLPLESAAAESFGAAIGEIRQAFRQVDIDLKKSCERLGAITSQLARL